MSENRSLGALEILVHLSDVLPDNVIENIGGRAGTRTPDLLRVNQAESSNPLITQDIFSH
jgi:hypothetical protein